MKTSMKTLLGIFAFMMIANFASAQYVANNNTVLGDGDNPYVGTTYTYTVTRGDAGSTIEWLVFDDSAMASPTAGANFTITDGATETPEIVWNTAGTYYLTYKETLNGCSTFRGLVVIVSANSFYLDLAADGEACNSEVDNVLDWTTYATKNDVKTELIFKVTMTKDAGFSIDDYRFTGDFTLPTGVSIAANSDISVTGGTKTIGTGTTNFTVSALATDAATTGEVVIKVLVSGKVTDGGAVSLALTNGKAVKGTIETADNLTLPASSDRKQIITLKPLAGSSNISF